MSFARIEILNARDENISVIFRRGPSKWVQILKWNTETDKILEGQWFNGRIYTRKSDLSPCGNFMIYFAGKFNEKRNQYSWTAISKPPYLTSIALWKKNDTFDGGGLFNSTNHIFLNHRKSESIPNEDSDIKQLKISLNKTPIMETFDIETVRLKRDNWKWSEEKSVNFNESDIQIIKKVNIETHIIHTANKKSNNEYSWKSYIKFKEAVLDFSEYKNIDINKQERIILSKDGCIYSIDDLNEYLISKELKLVVNLNDNTPYELKTPETMKVW